MDAFCAFEMRIPVDTILIKHIKGNDNSYGSVWEHMTPDRVATIAQELKPQTACTSPDSCQCAGILRHVFMYKTILNVFIMIYRKDVTCVIPQNFIFTFLEFLSSHTTF